MNEELLTILDHIEREKGIDKELLFKAIESALASAAKKIISDKEAEVAATIDRNTGEISILSEGKVIKSAEFGRIAAQTAKQVIIQKIREAERDIVLEDYTKRVGTIVNGSVHRFEKGDIVLDLGKTEAILPKSQQCHGERYKQGDRVRAYIMEVNKTSHGPQVILSRSDVAFVKKLFEIEVPEIMDGIVEIRSIAREPGERTKIAVLSKDEKVDAVGACVGMRGSRVKDIVNELRGERVDIVRWSDDIKEYAKTSLSPAEPLEVTVDKENKRIGVVVADDQLSIGIGKHGQNVRLASRLIGWEIDIRGKEEKAKKAAEAAALKDAEKKEAAEEEIKVEKSEKKEFDLTELEGVGPKTAKSLKAAGYDTLEKIKSLTMEDITKLEGIGEKTLKKILKSVKNI
ncbi:MAG: transcription termination factor NusA [Omnitrophica bacterium RIFCSPLOWO2_02_FULL_45_16]|nr:MAG: transcription termination factor NusA [Omnitrophica bacterium RIFCSPHIGHO2_02_FULL_46_20]OGW92881.1 MAG: transcription termination factor NusA [Omnitrophica bacterium RIFCSPLOWO2_01_FULL_45_24]OGW94172.1 MAG: transcription termination factor NusA [Omnitrophica bacterium RIFCSPLOWO2_12_FULL_45_13]OGX01275.1 MAG: transcription termination factor NusA [Omnitrophica bacterium RIFCSPLOWO2_02_FULL_45_16]